MSIDFYKENVINDLKEEFKEYIRKGLTVNEAIEKFNIKHYYNDNVEVYHSLCGTIELRYVFNINSITDDQEIKSIRKDVTLKNLYKKKKKYEKQMSNLTDEIIKINDEIDKMEASK